VSSSTPLPLSLLKDFTQIRPNLRQSAAWIALVVTVVLGLLISPAIVSPDHWPVLLRQAAPLGLLALGQTVLILVRGFDLSAGGVVGLVSVLAAGGIALDFGAVGVVVICFAMGILVGAINGAVVAWGKLSPLIATLGTGFVLTGAMLVYTGGAPTGEVPEAIRAISAGRVLGLSWGVYIWLIVTLVAGFLLKFSWPGRWVTAVGSSPEAARHAGIKVEWVKFGTHVFSSMCAVAGGLLLAGFVGIGTLGAGQDLMLNSLAAAVLGATVLIGGRGGVSGTVGGVILLTVLSALLTGAGIGEAGGLLTQGIVIIAAAALFRRSQNSL